MRGHHNTDAQARDRSLNFSLTRRIFISYTVGSIFNGRKYYLLMVGSIFDGRKHLKLRILTNQGKIEKNIKSLNQTKEVQIDIHIWTSLIKPQVARN